MGCNCGKKRGEWLVLTAAGKEVYRTGSQPVANAVSKRYPGSRVEKADPAKK